LPTDSNPYLVDSISVVTVPTQLEDSARSHDAEIGASLWRWSVFSLISLVALIGILIVLAGLVQPPDDVRALVSLLAEIVIAVVVAVAGRRVYGSLAALVHTIGLGVPTRADVVVWLAGCVAQFGALLSLGIVVTALDPGFDPSKASNTTGLSSAPPVALVLVGVAAVLIAPIVEETQFRGLLLRAGIQHHGFPLAAAGTSVLFGLFHTYEAHSLAGAAYLGIRMAVFGFVQCLVVRRTGRLTPAVMVHATFNAIALIAVIA
jgi:membrane protease YdiL (CAAX protease family)